MSSPKAVELMLQGRNEEIWQMCCGFLSLDMEQFMAIQKRLLMEQIELLSRCRLGKKIMRGNKPESVEEFRALVPLTTYSDYCPELSEKIEDALPAKPESWVHTSGRSGEYSCKWVPLSPVYCEELSKIMCGIGMLSASRGWGDTAPFTGGPHVIYTAAPRPYMSGAMANLVQVQTPVKHMPPLAEAESMSFEDRVKLGFQQALSQGLDFFFGLSLVLVAVGDKFAHSPDKFALKPFLKQPKALLRLTRGLLKSKLAGRPLLPRDLWKVRGIVCGGLDSAVYKEKIKELWGRYPLDVYASTEGSVVATQTWDYNGMTFIPNLNFLEFIPEKEHFKWQLDHRYQPKTVLLDEVRTGENYEIVLTGLHGSALVRYRVGDMVRITSLKNETIGIEIPQMVFERRADDLLDFVVIRLTEKMIWQAIEKSGVDYVDWAAYKKPGEPILNLLVELKDGYHASESNVEMAVYEQLLRQETDNYTTSHAHDDLADMIKFSIKVNLLPRGAFAAYTGQRQAEGADLAHLKPAHINPSEKVLSLLLAKPKVAVEAEARPREPVSIA